VDQLIKTVAEKVGIPPDTARAVVTKILGFLKAKMPESAASHLNAAVGGGLDSVPPTEGDLTEAADKAGLEPEKLPGVLQTVATWLKDRLPEGVRDEVLGSLAPGGGLLSKVAGWLGVGKS
jgi:hypothetical protein